MELLDIGKNGLYKLLVTGNSRLRILNDYEQNLIGDEYIQYNGTSLSIFVYNIYEFTLNTKFYAKITYHNKIPRITCLWEYDEFTPYYSIYPINPIKLSTINHFNIIDEILIDYTEMSKNNKILDDEHANYLYWVKPNKLNKLNKSIISDTSNKSIISDTSNKYISNDYISNDYMFDSNDVSDVSDVSDNNMLDCNGITD
jgi:hypothetical protein